MNDSFPYTQCGLDNVWLADGYKREETEYGAGFTIERADELHRLIAQKIIGLVRPLRGQEARFLRIQLNLSQGDMGKLLGIDRTTVMRWENQKNKFLNKMQDVAVRTTYAARSDTDSFILKVIREMQEADELKYGGDYKAVFETTRLGWRLRVA